MEESGISNVTVIALFAVMVITGAAALFIFANVMNTIDPDPYNYQLEYDVTGTVDGEACTGSGTQTYAPEFPNCHLYKVDVSVDPNGHRENRSFKVMFDMDDKPMDGTFVYSGEGSVGDAATSVWTCVEDSTTYKIWVGEMCRILRFEAESSGYILTGILR